MAVSTAVDISAVARVVGIKTDFKDLRGGQALFLPQRIAVFGQGSTASQGAYSLTKRQVFSGDEAGQIYGFGSPIHLAVRQLLPVNGDGVGTIPVTVYPLNDDASGVAAAGDITPSGAQTEAASYIVRISGIESEAFVISVGDSVADITAAMTAAINANVNMPVIAADNTTAVGLTAKWEGVSGNDIFVEVLESASAGTSFAITQPTGGLVNPDATAINTALAQVGDVWETMLLNCLDVADTTVLDAFSTWNEGRWGALTHKPAIAFVGNTIADVLAASAVADARKTDRTNSQLVAPGSVNLPFVVAARQLARIAVLANNNPPHDYGSQSATGLIPGVDGDQWNYSQRDAAVKRGSSTIEVKDGVVEVSDVVTFHHPTDQSIPAYRYVVDIVKLQNIIFNTSLIFNTDAWDGAPLIPDDQPTVNPDAKKPKMAKAELSALADSLGLNAIISDPKTAKSTIVAVISDQNPKRLDIAWTVQLSGNTNIISIDLNFGFFFGTPLVVA
jgi:phage tail sheath gpL-like